MSSLKRSHNEIEDIDINDINNITHNILGDSRSKIAKHVDMRMTSQLLTLIDRFIRRFCHHSSFCNNPSPNHNYYCDIHQPEVFNIIAIYEDVINHKLKIIEYLRTNINNYINSSSVHEKLEGLRLLFSIRWTLFIPTQDEYIDLTIKSLENFQKDYGINLTEYIEIAKQEKIEYDELKMELGL